jgi:hypothetical protein
MWWCLLWVMNGPVVCRGSLKSDAGSALCSHLTLYRVTVVQYVLCHWPANLLAASSDKHQP